MRPYRQWLADAALLLVTLIWGATFVMVKDAVTAYPVFSFLALRFVFAALALLPLIYLRQRGRGAKERGSRGAGETGGQGAEERESRGVEEQGGSRVPQRPHSSAPVHLVTLRQVQGRLLSPAPHDIGGAGHPVPLSPRHLVTFAPLLLGAALFVGYSFQTFGLQLTTPAKAGFITGLSVVIVPLAAALALRQSPSRNAWLGVGSATLGLALLTLQADLRIATGDLLVFGCALAFAAHILLTGRFSPRYDPLLLTLGQIVVVAVLSTVAAFALESPPSLTGQVVFAAAFTGVLATSAAFSLQTLAQRFTTATHTALIFAAEPVFAALFSFLLIGELLGPRQVIGCGLILAGMVVAEVKRQE